MAELKRYIVLMVPAAAVGMFYCERNPLMFRLFGPHWQCVRRHEPSYGPALYRVHSPTEPKATAAEYNGSRAWVVEPEQPGAWRNLDIAGHLVTETWKVHTGFTFNRYLAEQKYRLADLGDEGLVDLVLDLFSDMAWAFAGR